MHPAVYLAFGANARRKLERAAKAPITYQTGTRSATRVGPAGQLCALRPQPRWGMPAHFIVGRLPGAVWQHLQKTVSH